MADLINLLPEHVANQIAAGEVVERPASIVKELMENSVDAGASRIQVIIKDSGKTLVQVIDDGCGMSETDARMCFERHATSKIGKTEDLFDIRTMGFRGEAMAAIASVTNIEMSTRKIDNELGTHIIISGSVVDVQEPTSCAPGTNIAVKNLFFNTPVRRKFLKSDATEMNHIVEAFQRVALAHPDVAMSLTHNGATIHNLSGGKIFNRIVELVGKNMEKKLLPVEVETTVVNIRGYVGKAEVARTTPGDQFFFVNNRYMKHPRFQKAVAKAFENILPAGKIPIYFLYLTVDANSIDVNIHPQKTDIHFENESAIWTIIYASVREAVGKFNVAPSLDFSIENPIEIPTIKATDPVKSPHIDYNPNYNPFDVAASRFNSERGASSGQMRAANPVKDWQKLYAGLQTEPVAEITTDVEPVQTTLGLEFDEKTTQINDSVPAEFDGTVNKFFNLKGKYILTQVKSGLMIINQRRAKELITYHQLMNGQNLNVEASQQLLYPERIDINQRDIEVFREIIPELESMGFAVSDLGNGCFSISAVPAIFKGSISEWISNVMYLHTESYLSMAAELRKTLAESLAKYLSSGFEGPMSVEAMAELNNQLFACPNPTLTPSGKKVMEILDVDAIDKLLK